MSLPQKESNQINFFEPYLIFKTQPPVDLTLPANSKYILECEAFGSPRPMIYWQKNGQLLNQVLLTLLLSFLLVCLFGFENISTFFSTDFQWTPS